MWRVSTIKRKERLDNETNSVYDRGICERSSSKGNNLERCLKKREGNFRGCFVNLLESVRHVAESVEVLLAVGGREKVGVGRALPGRPRRLSGRLWPRSSRTRRTAAPTALMPIVRERRGAMSASASSTDLAPAVLRQPRSAPIPPIF